MAPGIGLPQASGTSGGVRTYEVPLAAAALQFVLGYPSVATVIPGAYKPSQVERNAAAFRHPMPADLWAELKHEGLLREDAPVPA